MGNSYFIYFGDLKMSHFSDRMKIKVMYDLIENQRIGYFSNKEDLFGCGDKKVVKDGKKEKTGAAA